MKLLILFLLNLFFLASGQQLYGKEAAAESNQNFPFVVKISENDCAGSDCACAGALIGGSWVLAPARCVRKNGKDLKVTVVAGDIYAGKDGNVTKKLRKVVKNPHLHSLTYDDEGDKLLTISHPKYDKDKLNNDIALLFFTKPFPSSSHIKAIILPPEESLKSGDECTVVGFGNKDGNDEAVLMHGKLKVASRTGKTVEFKAVKDKETFLLPESFSGLLVCRDSNGMRTLFGFLDGAEVGGLGKRYVRVNPFRKWIGEKQDEIEMNEGTYSRNMTVHFALYSISLSAFVVVVIRYFAARRY